MWCQCMTELRDEYTHQWHTYWCIPTDEISRHWQQNVKYLLMSFKQVFQSSFLTCFLKFSAGIDIQRTDIGGVAVGRWTRDQEVAGSTPAAALFGQQPWASCSHLMCLCSPSSIIWYLAKAFMLKAPYCWQRHRVKWTRGIVERFCGDLWIA